MGKLTNKSKTELLAVLDRQHREEARARLARNLEIQENAKAHKKWLEDNRIFSTDKVNAPMGEPLILEEEEIEIPIPEPEPEPEPKIDINKELLKENQILNAQLEEEKKRIEEEKRKADEEKQKIKEEYERLKAEKERLVALVKDAEEKEQAAVKAQSTLNKRFEDYVNAIEDIPTDWINAYEDKTGKKAIWQGRITEGFKEFIEKNGFLQ